MQIGTLIYYLKGQLYDLVKLNNFLTFSVDNKQFYENAE